MLILRTRERAMSEERPASNSERAEAAGSQKEEREREEREQATDQPTPRQRGGGMRALARGLATILFVVGVLLLAVFSNLLWTGEESVLAQIELGIWSMCFVLAAIYLKLEGR